jgi:hypothetical protein
MQRKNKMKEEELKEEKGVWIVYDLEANRMIQELLMKNKFAFRFDGSKEIIKREGISLAHEEELEFLKDLFREYRGNTYFQESGITRIKERIAQLEKEMIKPIIINGKQVGIFKPKEKHGK